MCDSHRASPTFTELIQNVTQLKRIYHLTLSLGDHNTDDRFSRTNKEKLDFMTASRKVELTSGIVTGVLALVVVGAVAQPGSVLDFLSFLPFYLVPSLLVAVGSYVHAIRRKTLGLVILLIGGLILTVMILLLTFGGVFYFHGFWGGLLSLAPSATAIVTLITSLIVHFRNN
jgi:hypothetical protein